MEKEHILESPVPRESLFLNDNDYIKRKFLKRKYTHNIVVNIVLKLHDNKL